jgi:hypothetical protein
MTIHKEGNIFPAFCVCFSQLIVLASEILFKPPAMMVIISLSS